MEKGGTKKNFFSIFGENILYLAEIRLNLDSYRSAPSWLSLLKSQPCGVVPLSAVAFAAASRVATTCVAPPAEQPCCSSDENRLYISRLAMNCAAYMSSFFTPSGLKLLSIIVLMLCQNSLLVMRIFTHKHPFCFALNPLRLSPSARATLRYRRCPTASAAGASPQPLYGHQPARLCGRRGRPPWGCA